MVVGDQHLHAQLAGNLHAFDAGDAVVHRDQQLRSGGGHAQCQGRGQAIAVGHAVGHQVADEVGPGGALPVGGEGGFQHAQAAQAHGAGGGPVAVVVGHDAHRGALGQRIGQHAGGGIGVGQGGGGQQAGQAVVQLVGTGHATGGVQAGQQRVDASLLQCPQSTGRNVTVDDFHS